MLRHTQRLAAAGVVVVLLGFVGLSLGSTMAKATHAPGSVVAFWRLLIGAVLWQVLVALRGARRGTPLLVSAEAWRLCALPGFVFGLNICLFFSGVDRTPIAHAEFISALAPLVMVPLTAIMLKERVPRPAIVAGGFALAGVVTDPQPLAVGTHGLPRRPDDPCGDVDLDRLPVLVEGRPGAPRRVRVHGRDVDGRVPHHAAAGAADRRRPRRDGRPHARRPGSCARASRSRPGWSPTA